MDNQELTHAGVKGMKWGVRRYQNPDGTLTPEGKKRYDSKFERMHPKKAKYTKQLRDDAIDFSIGLKKKSTKLLEELNTQKNDEKYIKDFNDSMRKNYSTLTFKRWYKHESTRLQRNIGICNSILDNIGNTPLKEIYKNREKLIKKFKGYQYKNY